MQKRPRLSALLLVLALSPACAHNPPPQIAASVATSGTAIIAVIQQIGDTTIAGEAAGLIPRNDARTAITAFKQAGDAGQKAADLLGVIATLPAKDAALPKSLADVTDLLGQVATFLNAGLVPINDGALRAKMSQLVRDVIATMTSVNKTLLTFRGVK